MGREPDILDESVRHQVYLERHAAELTRKLRRDLKRLEKVAAQALAKHGELAEIGAEEIREILGEVQADELQVMTDALADLTPRLEKLGLYEGEYTAKALKAATRGVAIKSLKAGEAYKAALDNPLASTGEMLDAFLDGWAKKQAKAVSDLVGKGYSQGWTNSQIVQAIRGTKAADYEDGLVEVSKRNAESIVRTSVQHVANAARNETWAKNSDVVVGWRFVATLDSNTTELCRGLDGRVFKLGEGPQPPLHIRCRSTTVPEIADEFAFLDEGATRSSENGYVSGNETYYSWLKRQPDGFQDDAIGPKRAQLLRDGGLSADEFARLSLGRNFQPLTLDEMRRKEPEAFKRAGL
jgi:SPP1 gp7 family putative phage head morphogenesis protein